MRDNSLARHLMADGHEVTREEVFAHGDDDPLVATGEPDGPFEDDGLVRPVEGATEGGADL